MRDEGRYKTRRLLPARLLPLILAVCAGCASEPDEHASLTSAAQRLVLDEGTTRYLGAAQQALKAGDHQAALAYVDSAAVRTPGLPDPYFLRGRILSELHRHDLAADAYREVISRDPDFRGAWFNLGNTAFRQKQYRDALGYYRAEQAKHPAAAVLLAIGRSYEHLGVVDSARVAFEEALASDPSAHEAHARLSRLLEQSGRLDEALLHAREALKLHPKDLDYRYLMGSLLLQTGHPGEAAVELKTVAAQDLWHYGAQYGLGQALLRLGQREEARAALARAEDIRARNAEIERLRALAKMSPDRPAPWLELAESLRGVGRYGEAIDAYAQAVFLDPKSPAHHVNLATLYLEAGDTLQAIRRYEAVVRRQPAYVDAWLNLGAVYATLGRADAARQAWEQVLAYDPAHATAKAWLAQLAATR